MGDDMVVTFSFDAFTRDELLARRLASDPGTPTSSGVGLQGLSVPCSALLAKALEQELPTVGSLVSSIGRILYRFINSNTGCDKEVVSWRVGRIFEVVLKTRPSSGGGGVYQIGVYKNFLKKKGVIFNKKTHPPEGK